MDRTSVKIYTFQMFLLHMQGYNDNYGTQQIQETLEKTFLQPQCNYRFTC